MQRVIVLGPPGSGKSTLARRLGACHGLPVFHLDRIYHRPGWRPAPEADFLAEVEGIVARPRWVIDGNHTSKLASRFSRADTLIYLDMPTRLTVPRVLRRTATGYGRVRADAAAGCPERFDMAFLRFAWSWNRRYRSKTLGLAGRFAGRTIVLHGRREQARFDREQFGRAHRAAGSVSV